jgi:glyoxylase-like metal-dependent hydrolase (beta-lactamase superfamily II)/8-oxo-dGTP pyrophosphatase MutT (NUDIX family)
VSTAGSPRLPIRPACTVVLLRDAPAGPEVLMLRRNTRAVMLGGAYVFPGGAVDRRDHDPHLLARVTGLPAHEADARMEVQDGGLGYWLAAVRETFEEAGILLAVDERGGALAAERWQAFAAQRAAVNAGTVRFGDLLHEHGLTIPAQEIVFFNRWITPPVRPRRFDTRFFIARAPHAQTASHDDGETVDSRWLRAQDALAMGERGEIEIVFATTWVLRLLAEWPSVAAALAAARAMPEVLTNRPCVAIGPEGQRIFRRGDPPYHEIHWSDPDETMATSYALTPGIVKRLDRCVARLVAPNPGVMTGPGTNTYLVGDRDLAVIDPGPADDAHIAAILAHGANRIRCIACTHTHRDHSPAAAILKAATGAQVIGMPPPADARQDATFAPDRVPAHDETLQLGDVALTALHTPGHASNHVCYHLAATGMLFTGDHVMQGSTVVINPPDGNMRQYLASLESLLAREIAIIAPGHGYLVGEPHREVRHLLRHRRWREARVLAAVERRQPATIETMLDDVYPDLPPFLRGPAARSLLAHLEKLVEDARVAVDGERYSVRPI